MVLSASTLPPVWQVGSSYRVADVLDGADGVAAHRAGLAGAVVHRAGPFLRRAHVVAAALVGQRLVDARAAIAAWSARPRRRRASRCWRTARASPGGRSRWPGGGRCPAMACWSRRNAVQPHGVGRAGCAASAGVVDLSASGPSPSSGSWPSGSPAPRTHTPARCSVPASVSRRARPSSNAPAGQPAARLGRLLLVGLEPAALHEVDDEGGRRRSRSSRYLPRRPTSSSGVTVGVSGGGATVFSAVKVMGRKPDSGAPPNSAVEPLGVGLELGQLGHRSRLAGRRWCRGAGRRPRRRAP